MARIKIPFPKEVFEKEDPPSDKGAPKFTYAAKLKNIKVSIPLVQAIQDNLMYAKQAKNLRVIHVDGAITYLMLGTCVLPKYADPR